eukprot:m51a1_g11462 putative leucine-rich repeat-containing protein (1131) ;mRNA; f:7713-12153
MSVSIASPSLSDVEEEEDESSRSEAVEGPDDDAALSDDEEGMTTEERLLAKTEKLQQCEETIASLIARITAYQKIVEEEKERDQLKIKRMVEEQEAEREQNLEWRANVKKMLEELDENNKALSRELTDEQEAHKQTIQQLFALKQKIDDPDGDRKDDYSADHEFRVRLKIDAGKVAGLELMEETSADQEIAKVKTENEFMVRKVLELKQNLRLVQGQLDEEHKRAEDAEEQKNQLAEKMKMLIQSYTAMLQKNETLEAQKGELDKSLQELRGKAEAQSHLDDRCRHQLALLLRRDALAIYEKYCAEGAELQVPLASQTRAALHDALAVQTAAQLPQDLFEAARAETAKILEAEHVPRWRRQARELQAQLPDKVTVQELLERQEELGPSFRDYACRAMVVNYWDFCVAARDYEAICAGGAIKTPTLAIRPACASPAAATSSVSSASPPLSLGRLEGGDVVSSGIAAMSSVGSHHGKKEPKDRSERSERSSGFFRSRRVTVMLPKGSTEHLSDQEDTSSSVRQRSGSGSAPSSSGKSSSRKGRKDKDKDRERGDSTRDLQPQFDQLKTGSTGDLPRALDMATGKSPSEETITVAAAKHERKLLKRSRGESLLRVDKERRSSIGDPLDQPQRDRRASSVSLQLSQTSDQLPTLAQAQQQQAVQALAQQSQSQQQQALAMSLSSPAVTAAVMEAGMLSEGRSSTSSRLGGAVEAQSPEALPMSGLQIHTRLPGPVTCVVSAKKNVWVACGGSSGCIVVLDRETSAVVQELPFGSTVRDMAVVNKSVWIGAEDQRLRVFDLYNPQLSRELIGHTCGPILGVEAVGAKHVWSIGTDQKICVWDVKAGKLFKTIYAATYMTCLAVSGTTVWIGTAVGIAWWDGATMKQAPPSPTKEANPKYSVNKLALVDREVWAASFDDDAITIWDAERRAYKEQITATRVKDIVAIGSQVWTCSWDKMIRIWDRATRQCLREIPLHEDAVVAMAVAKSSSALRIWAGSDDNSVSVWNTQYQGHELTAGSMRSHNCYVCGRTAAMFSSGQTYVCKVCDSFCVHAKCADKVPVNTVCPGYNSRYSRPAISLSKHDESALPPQQPQGQPQAQLLQPPPLSPNPLAGGVGGALAASASSPTRQLSQGQL